MEHTNTGDRARFGRTGGLWLAGGAVWLAAGAIPVGQHGWRFDAVEALWIVADVLLLAGLLGLRTLQPYGQRRLGSIGMGIALIGRIVFIAAEVLSVGQQTDQNPLLPLGAVLSAVGMVGVGVAVARSGVWRGVARFGPLTMGLFPFLVMFPLLAASGGEPPVAAITGWGLAAAVVGLATLAQATPARDVRRTHLALDG